MTKHQWLAMGLGLVLLAGGAYAEDEAFPQPTFEPIFEGQTVDNTYVNGQGDMVVFSVDGKVATREAFVDDLRQKGETFKTDSRKWVEDAVGAEKKGYRKFGESETETLEVNVHDDVRVNEVVNATLASQQRLEQLVDDDLAKAETEAKRPTPLRTLRSLESGQQQ